MGHETTKQSEVLRTEMWRNAYRSYFRFWVNLAKTVRLTDEEAKDVVHGVIASLLNNAHVDFESMDHVRNYVSKSVVNRAIQFKQRRDRQDQWTETLEIRFATNPEGGAEEEERLYEAAREGVRGLSRRDFEIIKLRFYSGLTFLEISGMLGIPISTLKSRETVALKKLRESLRKKGY